MTESLDEVFEKGVKAHEVGELKEADNYFRSVLEEDPRHLGANFFLGMVTAESGHLEDSLPFFEVALEIDSTIDHLWASYIDTLLKLTLLDKAKSTLEEARGKGITGAIFDGMDRRINELSLDPPPEQYDALVEFHSQGRHEEALDQAQSLIEKFPRSAPLYYTLGAINSALDLTDAAVESYQQAININPNFAEAHCSIGDLMKAKGDLDAAINSYQLAVQIKPDYVGAHNNMGGTFHEKGELGRAEDSYRKALKDDPNNEIALNNLGAIFQARGDLDAAIVSYKSAIKSTPDYIEAYNNLGIVLQEKGDLDSAIFNFEKVLALDPFRSETKNNLDRCRKKVVPDWHLSMMNDSQRNNAFLAALRLAVRPESLVLEIGTGSGLLSMMAARNGAQNIITCESSNLISKNAEKIIQSNGYEDRISVRHKKSTELIVGKDIPKKADLIISEILSAEFVGEGVRTTLRDANQRLLHEDGKMIPESGEIMVGLLGDTPEIASQVRVERVSGFDLSLFNSISSRKFSFILNEKAVLLSEPQSAFKINLTNLERSVQENKILQLRVCADGICLGLIQWLRLQLFRDVGYENDPSKDSSHWPTPIYLFEKPIRVRIGDIVEVRAALTEDSVWFDQ